MDITLVSVTLAIESTNTSEIADEISALLTNSCKAFTADSLLLDWRYTKKTTKGRYELVEVPEDFNIDSL